MNKATSKFSRFPFGKRTFRALESIKYLCGSVATSKDTIDYIRYFCTIIIENKNELKENE